MPLKTNMLSNNKEMLFSLCLKIKKKHFQNRNKHKGFQRKNLKVINKNKEEKMMKKQKLSFNKIKNNNRIKKVNIKQIKIN